MHAHVHKWHFVQPNKITINIYYINLINEIKFNEIVVIELFCVHKISFEMKVSFLLVAKQTKSAI